MFQRVNIMVDYNADLPLWFDESCNPIHILSGELLQDLRNWQRWFDLHYDLDLGWDSPSSNRAHTKWGESLRARVSGELGPDVEVSLHTWTKGQS